MNKHYIYLITILIFCGTLFSCQSTKTPLQVSEHFWLGIKTKNMELVKKYSLANSIDKTEDIAQFENVTDFTFGRIIIDGDVAKIETNVTILSDENVVDIPLNTYLKNNNDVWKVNYKKTVFQLVLRQNANEVFGDIEQITEEIADEIKESIEEIKEKVVPEIKSEIEQVEKEFLEKLPEFKNLFEEFLHDLEESLEEMMPTEKEPKTQET
jgi:gas vesicle protein